MEWLKEILGESYTEEIEKAVSAKIGKDFVSRSDFNAKNEKVKALEGQIAQRDEQLENLKFQSTLPVWGATGITESGGKDIKISIHAPRVGSDLLHYC